MKPDPIVAPVVSSALSPARYAALQRWLRGDLPRSAVAAIPRRAGAAHAPLSSGQLRLWMLQQIDPASTAYNEADAVRLHGPLDVDALRAASNAIVERHGILRTTYQMIDGQLRQVTAPRLALPMVVEDLSASPPEPREAQLRDRLARAVDRPFDLARGPIVRTRLFRLGPEEHVLLRCVHHCAWDEWSTVIWTRELVDLYARLAAGTPAAAAAAALPPLPIQYADYAAWEHEQWLDERPALAADLAYWRDRLANCSPVRLLTDRPRSVPVDERARNCRVAVSEMCSARLHALVRRERTTLFTVLLAAFQLLLARDARQDDICVGTPVANRSRAETENLIGFFVNTVVVRTDLSGDPTLGELLRRVQRETIGAVDHQELPFERLVAAVNPERDSGRSPLFQVLFAFQSTSHQHEPSSGLTPERLSLDAPATKFDLQLVMGEVPSTSTDAGALAGTFTYRTALFDDATIERLADRYHVLLEAMASSALDRRISTLPLMSETEQRRVMGDWRAVSPHDPRHRSVLDVFALRVAERAREVAIVSGERRVTYAALDVQSDAIANALVRRGVRPGMVTAIGLEPSADFCACLLGVLKAGAAYLPLDLAGDPRRAAAMLEESRAPLLVINGALPSSFPAVAEIEVVTLGALLGEASPAWSVSRVDPAATACLLYTSGTAGRAKAAVVSHRAIARLVSSAGLFRVDSGDAVAQSSNITTATALLEIWGSLLNGHRLVIMPQGVWDSPTVAADLDAAAVQTLFVGARQFRTIVRREPRAFRSVRDVIVVGGHAEIAALERVRRSGDAPRRLIRAYSLTEGPACVCWSDRDVDGRALRAPVGGPVAHVQLLMLDPDLQPVPADVIGAIWLGGETMADGYWRHPRLTAETFLPNPYGSPGSRMLRTGDLGRWRPPAGLEIVGRVADTVTIHGYPVDVAEIEMVVRLHPEVDDCAVVVGRDDGNRPVVAARVMAAGRMTARTIQQFVRDRLGLRAVPEVVTFVAALPSASNGRCVRLPALLDDRADAARRADRATPQTETERMLAAVWQEVLGIERVGRDDVFFELGGDSIQAIQASIRGQRAGLRFRPSQLWQAQTIAELAALVDRGGPTADDGPVTGASPITPIQSWFFDWCRVQPQHFNHALMFRLRRPLDREHLASAVRAIVDHHDSLRLRFAPDEAERAGWRQWYAPQDDSDATLVFDDLRAVPPAERAAAIEAAAARHQASLDLTNGPLFRVVHLDLGGDETRLLIIAHHVIIDGVSWRILLEDLHGALAQCAAGESIQLAWKTSSYARWAEHQRQLASSDDLGVETSAWALLGSAWPPLPGDAVDAANTSSVERVVHVTLPAAVTRVLIAAAPAATGVPVPHILLASLLQAWQVWMGHPTLPIVLEGHGRDPVCDDIDVSRTVGWFTTLYPAVLTSVEEPGLDALAALHAVSRQLARFEADGQRWGRLRYLGADEVRRELAARALPSVSFNYLGQLDRTLPEDSPFELATEGVGPLQHPDGVRPFVLAIDAQVLGGCLHVLFRYSRARHSAGAIQALADDMLRRLEALLDAAVPDRSSDGIGPAADILDLSPPQARIYEEMSGQTSGHSVHTVTMAVRLDGALDVDALERSVAAVVRRHGALRATVHIVDGRPQQRIASRSTIRPALVDLSGVPPARREAVVVEIGSALARTPFDCSREVMRGAIARLGPDTHALLLSVHHLFCDDWSIGVLSEELLTQYDGERRGESARLPPLEMTYSQYVRRHTQPSNRRSRPRPTTGPIEVGSHGPAAVTPVHIDAGVVDALSAIARSQHAPLATALLAGFASALHVCSNEVPTVVVVPVAGRDDSASQRLIGMFVRLLIVAVDCSGRPSVGELIQRALRATAAAYRRDEQTRDVGPGAASLDVAMPPLARQVVFNFLQAPPSLDAHGPLRVRPLAGVGTTRATRMIELKVRNAGVDGLDGRLVYRADLLTAAVAGDLVAEFQRVLASASHDVQARS